jgi:magnesium-transporting ATPase (P-type)
LKAAHLGIALSDSEASVVSPFTSLDKSITSVLDVLKEGRCTLASAISSYKYMIMYGQVETINQIICVWFAITFSEWCWVFMDGFWVITMAFSLPFADVAQKLAPSSPTSSILGPHTLTSVLGVLLINFLFVVLALGLLFSQEWFFCRKWIAGEIADVTAIGDNYEASVVFLVSGYQYVSSGMAFNFGFQYRAGWLYNW